MKVAAWWVMSVGLIACTPTIPGLPSAGGAAWFEVKSEHFTLWTDASEQRGHELVREMERRRQVILATLNAPSNTAAFVIALRNAGELTSYVRGNFDGVAWSASNPTGQPGVLLAADNRNSGDVLGHELAHVISYGVIANQPDWLAEGIATYFGSMTVEDGETSTTVGMPRSDFARALRSSHLIAAKDLFACASKSCKDHIFYATSWALFSFLLHDHLHALERYCRYLNVPQRDQIAWHEQGSDEARHDRQIRGGHWQQVQQEAWRDAFPDLPPEKLDRVLREWLITGKMRVPRVKLMIRTAPTQARRLDDADVLAVRSFLQWQFIGDRKAVQADADAAIARDRTHVLARLVDASIHGIALADARATVAAHPDDWRALRLLALALHGTAEGDQVRARMCTLASNGPPECAHTNDRRTSDSASRHEFWR